MISRKSEKATAYAEYVRWTAPRQRPVLEGPIAIMAHVWYASMRPDIDLGVLFDVLQGIVYRNDRQIVEQHIVRYVDKENPRVQIVIEELEELA